MNSTGRILLYDLNPTGHCPSWDYWSAVGLRSSVGEVVAAICLERVEVQPWADRLSESGVRTLPIPTGIKRHLDYAHQLSVEQNCGAIFFPNMDSILFNCGKYQKQSDLCELVMGGILLRPDEIGRPPRNGWKNRIVTSLFQTKDSKQIRKKNRIHRLTYGGWSQLFGEDQTDRRYLYLVEQSEEVWNLHATKVRGGGVLRDPWISRSEVDRRTARRELGLPESAHLFLHAGTARAEKGLLDTCKAIGALNVETAVPYYLFRAGPCGSFEEQHALEHLQRKGKLIWKDAYLDQEQLNLCYAAADWVLLPYRYQKESSGILVNAAAHHRPVIGSNYGKIGEFIQSYGLGMVYPHLDVAALGVAVEKAVANLHEANFTFDRFVEDHSPENFAAGFVGFAK